MKRASFPLLQELTSILYAAARLTLAQCWKRPWPPQLKHWCSKVVEPVITTSKVSDLVSPPPGTKMDTLTHYDLLWFPALSQILSNPTFGGVSRTLEALLSWRTTVPIFIFILVEWIPKLHTMFSEILIGFWAIVHLCCCSCFPSFLFCIPFFIY